jgi:hypothetical protein
VFGCTDVDGPLRPVEQRSCLQQVERRPDLRCARGCPGRPIVAAPHEQLKPLATDGPGFSVAGNYDVGKCGAGGGVKQLLTLGDVAEHIGCRQDRHPAADGVNISILEGMTGLDGIVGMAVSITARDWLS